MALSSAVVTANRSFWTGAKVAFPAPEVAPAPEFPELDEHPVVNAVNADNAASAVNAVRAALLATFVLVPASCGRGTRFMFVIARSLAFMFPVTKD
jgi:hypothetical protein